MSHYLNGIAAYFTGTNQKPADSSATKEKDANGQVSWPVVAPALGNGANAAGTALSKLTYLLWTKPAAASQSTAEANGAAAAAGEVDKKQTVEGTSAVGRVAVVLRRKPMGAGGAAAPSMSGSLTELRRDGDSYLSAQRLVLIGNDDYKPKGPPDKIFLPKEVSGVDVGVYPTQAETAAEYDTMLAKFQKRTDFLESTVVPDLLKTKDYLKAGEVVIFIPDVAGKAFETVIPYIIGKDLDRQTIEIDGVVMKKEGNTEDLRKQDCYATCHAALGKKLSFTNNVLKLCTQGVLFDAFLKLKVWFSSDDYSRDIVQPQQFHFKVSTKEAAQKENAANFNPSMVKFVSESLYPVKNSQNEQVLRNIKVTVEILVPLNSLQGDVNVGVGGTYSVTAELA
jgi:hypothetical protein